MIKMILLLLFISHGAIAGSWAKSRSDGESIILKTQLKGTHKGAILNFDFYKDKKLLSCSNDNIVKIWDIHEQELLKSIPVSGNLLKATFSQDGSKIYLLTRSQFLIVDAKSYKVLNSIEGERFTSFVVTDNEKRVILTKYSYENAVVYSLENGKQLFTIDNTDHASKAILSPNQKYIALMYNNRVKFYRSDSGDYISQLPQISDLRDIHFVNNKNITVVENHKAVIYNDKTSEALYEAKSFHNSYINSFYALNDEATALIVSNDANFVRLIDLEKNSILKKAKIDAHNSVYNGLALSKDRTLLAVGYRNGDFKLYKTDGFLLPKKIAKLTPPEKPQVEEKPQVAEKPKVVVKPKVLEIPKVKKVIEKQKVVEDVVVKKIKKVQKNQAPTLLLEASTLSGVIPLKVDFTILTSDDKGVESYYINIAGHESIQKGTPPTTLTKTFQSAGEYKVIVAVKDREGLMTTKSLTIKAREETFSDYKKMYQ